MSFKSTWWSVQYALAPIWTFLPVMSEFSWLCYSDETAELHKGEEDIDKHFHGFNVTGKHSEQ